MDKKDRTSWKIYSFNKSSNSLNDDVTLFFINYSFIFHVFTQVNERFFQYLGSFNIFEGQELVGGAEFVLTGGRIAVAEFQLNTLPGRQCTVVHHLAAREKLSALVPRLGQPGAGPRLPSRL